MTKNINLFYGDNSVFLKNELDRWIKRFKEKHGEYNITKIDKESLSKTNIINELLTPPFLSEYRLIIINNIFFGKENTKNDEEKEIKKIEEDLINSIDNIPPTNIVLFVNNQLSKKGILYKKIREIGNIKEFNDLGEDGIKKYIREKLLGIDSKAIEKLVKYKGYNLNKIDEEVNKLELFRNKERISVEDIEKYINPEIEVTIFEFIDAIYLGDYNQALTKFDAILENSKIEPVFAGIMTNFRKYLFVIYLIDNGYSKEEIIDKLKINPYFFQKIFKNKNKYLLVLTIYNKLSLIDYMQKTGKLIGDNEVNIKLALEKLILDLKNNKIGLK